MPELPEVETVRRDLEKKLVGKKILSIEVYFPGSVHVSPLISKPGDFSSLVSGRKILGISRRGKLLVFSLSGKLFLLAHLKMTGQLIFQDRSGGMVAGGHSLKEGSTKDAVGGDLPNRFTRVELLFSNGSLFFNDLRKFGYLKLVEREEMEAILESGYGLEPGLDFPKDKFISLLSRFKAPIKSVLLNQKLIAGLGNIYADESLFAARILPKRPASSLNIREANRLWREIDRIIAAAVEARGTTFRDFRDGQGGKGNFSSQLSVYGRTGAPCVKCGKPIVKKKQGGRGTHFCEHCQK